VTNCPNCGAPITNDICAYCGTVFINPKGYEDLKKELQNAKFRASLEAQNMELINSINLFRNGILSSNEVRGLVGFGEVGRSTWSALMN
jgi:hypothetical protein